MSRAYEQTRVRLRENLAEMSSQPIGRYDYVAYFLNERGETLIFWVERTTGASWLLMSINGYDKLSVGRWKHGGIGDPAILLAGGERRWFLGCLEATDELSDKWTTEANRRVVAVEISV